MQFDSNRAWNDAVAAVRANRDVMLALGGVFFLLPALLATVILSPMQMQIMENLGKEAVVRQILLENMWQFVVFGFGGWAVQFIGFLAVTALLSDRGRPTVGEAIAIGLRALPTIILITLVFFVGFFVAVLVTGVIAGLGAAVAGGAGGGVLGVVAALAAMVAAFYASIKLSLVMPLVVKEREMSPIRAMLGSWRYTKGNSLRLLGFFALLFIGYMAISVLAAIFVSLPVSMVLGAGAAATFVTGVVSGAVGAAANIVLSAVLVQVYFQLAGQSPENDAGAFE